jgi:hypothetical protein
MSFRAPHKEKCAQCSNFGNQHSSSGPLLTLAWEQLCTYLIGKGAIDGMVDCPTNVLAFSEGKVHHVITIRVSAHQSFQ